MKFVLLLFPILLAQVNASSIRTVLDRVYDSEQADKGEKLYESRCVKCHEGNDPEGPVLIGRTFIERWREDDLEALFSYMSDRMPADEAGSLPSEEYLQLLSFLLRANSYASGTQPLTVDALPGILLVGADGPKPLPVNTLVQLVGCFTQISPEEWSLTQSTPPARSRKGKETTPEELKKSAAKPLGTHTFPLRNFTNISFDFKPDPLKGHKVQVKGVLIRQSGSDRINVIAIDTLAPTCGPGR